jgi:hypothetical protein
MQATTQHPTTAYVGPRGTVPAMKRAFGKFAETRRSWLILIVVPLVMVLPIWIWPLAGSQDGPCHLYNAVVLNEALAGTGTSLSVYDVAWQPIPNWGGPLMLMGLLKIVPVSLVPKFALTATCILFIVAIVVLHRVVRGSTGLIWTVLGGSCLATGQAWALGFESFTVGSAAAFLSISLWYHYSESLDALKSLAIAALLAVVFFCHLVPWGFAAGTIGFLALAGATRSPMRRLGWSAGILLTTIPCLIVYRSLIATNGGLAFNWEHLQGLVANSPEAWRRLLQRVDCIGLMDSNFVPFTEYKTVVMRVINPFWMVTAAIGLQLLATLIWDVQAREFRRLSLLALGAGGTLLAVLMPDGKDPNGTYLPFRIMLLSLVVLLVTARFDLCRPITTASRVLLVGGFALQAAAVWDFAATTNKGLGKLEQAARQIPPGQRIFKVGTKPNQIWRFRANPLRHADGYLAAWSGGILLSNYEAAHYYFPVKLRSDYPVSLIARLNTLELFDLREAHGEFSLPEFLGAHQKYIDVLVLWSADPRLIATAQEWFPVLLDREDELWILGKLK